jgi:methylated-DNA-[protein]-cysteine S-methyltransferase
MPDALTLVLDQVATPIGELLFVADEAGSLRALDWSDYETRLWHLLELHYAVRGYRLERGRLGSLRSTVERYFEGDVAAIDGLPVETGGTRFQRLVWRALRNIPCGSTISYRTLAEQLGNPAAVRAVGHANGANPVGIVVPCHRVIGSNGSLTGYAGGVERKRWLLDHERKHAGRCA